MPSVIFNGVAGVFHLRNTSANCQLNVLMNGQRLAFNPEPVYLGVALDRTLSFKAHLQKTSAKLKNRNNLLSRLDKLLCNVEAHPNWPLYADVFDHPQKRLVARRPI